ncbi:DUF4340 domain-containing protein [Carboxylicivirga caseinilyticus]|uniref:DUF4340 domain-containing protein n=1 Tax=Carboxylicivirga caseinilyticus TaxID=3417572 RepID=UPI003D3437DB|nr:DUF4340 domain-containing protein [Marinilabiliaceae bacterium A049]
MFRKLNIKLLGLVFLGLLVVTVLVKVIDGSKGINTLKDKLFSVDETKITSVVIQPKMLNGQPIELKKENDSWKVLFEGKSYQGDKNLIESLISQVNGLKPLRLAAQSTERWVNYELTDSLATKVQLMGSGGELATLYIGKFSYQQPKQTAMMQQNPYMQQRGTMTTYVRSGNDSEVYAVAGFLGSSANRDANSFRDKTIVKVDKGSINKIDFTTPETSFTMVKNENTWMVDGTALDSTAVAKYLTEISSLKGTSFVNDNTGSFSHKLTIFSDNGENIEINAIIKDEDVVLTSSQNSGSVFKEKKDRIFKKLFVLKSDLENK